MSMKKTITENKLWGYGITMCLQYQYNQGQYHLKIVHNQLDFFGYGHYKMCLQSYN